MLPRALKIEIVPIASLRLNPKNPRMHSNKQLRKLAESIRVFGFIVPLLIDAFWNVIAGHGRVQASKLLGITEVPVIRLEHLSEDQIRAFTIADNRLSEIAEWDDKLLGEQLKILSEAEIEFSLEVTGFEMAEIDLSVENLASTPESDDDPANAMPVSGVPVTRPGDQWILGRNRLYCGNALDDESYIELMQGRRARAVFADAPYNDPIDGYVAGFGNIHPREFAMASGEMSEAQFTEFLSKIFQLLARHSEAGSLHFVCQDWRHLPEMLAASRGVYSEFKNLCVWVKESGGQGSLYRSRHELIAVFKSGKEKHRNNIQLGQYGRYRTNVWEYARVNSRTRNDEEQLSGLHPTIKPAAMVADAILDCTSRNDIVLDPFLGSGTTIIAAERTGRICYGLELDPSYVDIIIRRWQTFTGKTAVHEKTGRPFTELEQEVTHEG